MPSRPAQDLGRTSYICYAHPVHEELSPAPLARLALDQLDSLYGLARHLTGNDGDAEDLVQDTFARALGAESQFVRGTNVRAWLFRILRNLFIDKCRRGMASPVRSGVEVDESADDGGPPREPLRGDGALEQLRGLVAGDIESALRSIAPDACTIVLLDLEGFTESELAEVLGCGIGTVKSRLSRARAQLRERLRDYAR